MILWLRLRWLVPPNNVFLSWHFPLILVKIWWLCLISISPSEKSYDWRSCSFNKLQWYIQCGQKDILICSPIVSCVQISPVVSPSVRLSSLWTGVFLPQFLAQSETAKIFEIAHFSLIGEETARNPVSTRLILRRDRVIPFTHKLILLYPWTYMLSQTVVDGGFLVGILSLKNIQKLNFFIKLFDPTITNPSQEISESIPFWQLNSPCEQSLSENFWHFAVGNWEGQDQFKYAEPQKFGSSLVISERQFPWLAYLTSRRSYLNINPWLPPSCCF